MGGNAYYHCDFIQTRGVRVRPSQPKALSVNKISVTTIFLALAGKLVNAPFVAGQFQSSAGVLANYFFDATILVAVLVGSRRIQTQFVPIFAAALTTALAYCVSTLILGDGAIMTALSNHLRVYLPLLAFPLLLASYSASPEWFIGWVRRICMLVCALILAGLFFFPESNNRSEIWWPSYFGGLHTTAYVALLLAVLVYCLHLKGKVGVVMAASGILVVSASIFFGWGVRTATIATTLFVIAVIARKIKQRGLVISTMSVAAVTLLSIYIVFFFDIDRLDLLTSGRIAMYGEKYNQIAGHSLAQWLIGAGAGSDLIESDVWWWAEKGAHSDLITMLVEGGIVYLAGFLLTLWTIFRGGGFVSKGLILAALFTSIVSNGIYVRPMVSYLLVIALAIVYAHDSQNGRRVSSVA